jgi:hypothetical protein
LSAFPTSGHLLSDLTNSLCAYVPGRTFDTSRFKTSYAAVNLVSIFYEVLKGRGKIHGLGRVASCEEAPAGRKDCRFGRELAHPSELVCIWIRELGIANLPFLECMACSNYRNNCRASTHDFDSSLSEDIERNSCSVVRPTLWAAARSNPRRRSR